MGGGMTVQHRRSHRLWAGPEGVGCQMRAGGRQRKGGRKTKDNV
jgi:hypothetical protein